MATSIQPQQFQWKRIALITTGLACLLVGGLIVLTSPTVAQADLAVDDLTVADVNETVEGDVSAVTLDATLDYQFDVPDAERRIVRVLAGPTNDSLEELTYTFAETDSGVGSGSVNLTASLLDHSAYTAADFNPALASSATQTVVVAAEIEIQRAGGGTVTDRVVEPVEITVHDGATLSANVGGRIDVSVT